MPTDKFQDTVKALAEINKEVAKLDPAIRAEAFLLLKDVYFGKPGKTPKGPSEGGETMDDDQDEDEDGFFTKFDHDKPADNVLLITAWLYSNYGKCVITTSRVNSIADDKGLTIPANVSMTIKQAARNKKSLFTKSGKGWKVTVWGERYLKDTYQVKKGKKPCPTEESE